MERAILAAVSAVYITICAFAGVGLGAIIHEFWKAPALVEFCPGSSPIASFTQSGALLVWCKDRDAFILRIEPRDGSPPAPDDRDFVLIRPMKAGDL